ncbi:MAG: Ni/Fe hydrogenase subunit alpha [Armatimonadota bacterium]
MSKTVEINVHHVTRVEGHGNIHVRINDGSVEHVEWQVPEAPRFFEAMVRGRSWEDIQTIVSRICGICSVSHSLVALKAIEDAMDIEVSEQTETLRILALYGEHLESHVLHIGYLVAPDLLGVKSVVPLVNTHPELLKLVIRLHKLGNTMMEILGGRRTHPVSFRPGGFGHVPSDDELRTLKTQLTDAIADYQVLVDAVFGLANKIPNFERDTEYIALTDRVAYPLYHGNIGSSDTTKTMPAQKFKSVVNEYVVPQSTAKWAKWHRDSYAVGALARIRLNNDYLLPLARDMAVKFGITHGCCNPYMNTVAQLVEVAQVVEHSIQLIDQLLTAGVTHELPRVKPRAGWGAGAVEAPRGVLFHSYAFDDNGTCTGANLTIPTNQNHANIQLDMEKLVPLIAHQDPDDIRLQLEMLVRAYDPCISCSTHYVDVQFV